MVAILASFSFLHALVNSQPNRPQQTAFASTQNYSIRFPKKLYVEKANLDRALTIWTEISNNIFQKVNPMAEAGGHEYRPAPSKSSIGQFLAESLLSSAKITHESAF
jgi:hypothetical protein